MENTQGQTLMAIMMASQGNPGCMGMMLGIFRGAGERAALEMVAMQEVLRLTGTQMYMIWNDALNRDNRAMLKLWEDIRSGRLPIATVRRHLAADYCSPFKPGEYEAEDEAWSKAEKH